MSGEAAKNPAAESWVDIKANLEKMTAKQLRRECANWRKVWDYLDDDIKSFLMQIGQDVLIFKRDGKGFEGSYGRPICTVIAHEFETVERLHSTYHKKILLYRTTSRIPITNIVDFKFVNGVYEDPQDNEWAQKQNAETASQAETIAANAD